MEWHPREGSVLAAASADNSVTLWDLSLERDEEAEATQRAQGSEIPDIPPQIVFIHQGQEDIKEVHWHPQLVGALGTTSADGFNIFKTENVD